jgi:hypothetical protein
MAGAHQHAAVPRHERKDVTGRDDCIGAAGRVDRDRDGPRPIAGGNAGGDPVPRLDRHGEGGLVAGAVVMAHHGEAKLVGTLAGDGKADQAAAVHRHEIDRVRGRHLRGDDEVALILPVLVVDQDEHPAVAGLLDNLLDAGERPGHQAAAFARRRAFALAGAAASAAGARLAARAAARAARRPEKTPSPSESPLI